MSKKSRIHKVKETGTSISYSSSNLQTDFATSCKIQDQSILTMQKPKKISESSRLTTRGRGMFIQHLVEESTNTSDIGLKNPEVNFANSDIEYHMKNLRITNTKELPEENNDIFRTPNKNEKSFTTKLRGTEMKKSHSCYSPPQTSSSLQTNFEPFNLFSYTQDQNTVPSKFTIVKPKQMSEPRQPKCRGRGMIIKKIEASMNTVDNCSNNLGMSYANSNIERHFKNLRKNKTKELEEENEELWGCQMLNSRKSS